MDPQGMLTTERLDLEPLEADRHADDLFDLLQDPDLYTFIDRSVPASRPGFRDSMAFLEKRLSNDGEEDWLNWIARERSTGAVVSKVEATVRRASEQADLAYYTFRPNAGKGFAKEACARVIEHLFQEWNVEKVVIEMDVRNTASVRLAESLGAERVAHTLAVQEIRGEWSDEYRYEIRQRQPSP